jgi:hypothetical protein
MTFDDAKSPSACFMVAVPVLSALLLKAVFEKPLWHRLIPAMRGRLPRQQEASVPPQAVSPNFPV